MTSSDSNTRRPGSGIGIDYGTSNSVAAVFDGSRVHLAMLENNSPVMPSATYVDRDLRIRTGQQAIDQYIESNMGRTVELSAEVLGEGRGSTGQIGDRGLPEEASTETFYGQSVVDAGQPGRLFRGVKRLLGSGRDARLMVFDRPFRLVALITPLLLRIRESLTRLLQQLQQPAADHACIGHPVNFEGSDGKRNSTALRLLAEAYGYAGFERQSFYPEPIAAALSYLHAHGREEHGEQTLLAVDFGGGTLDLCILRRRGQDFGVLATHGISLGGDHIDQALFRDLLFPLLGKGERWRRSGEDREIETLFPFEDYEELLLNWPISYMLNQNRYTSPLMQRIQFGDAAAIKFMRLYDLIKNNYSYLVFQSLKELKANLSTQQEAHLDIPELDLELVVTRAQFERIIGPLLTRLEQALEKVLDAAGVTPADIQLVIRTGGSSLIPAVRTILEQRFPNKVIEHDPFTSVAAGLAIAEYKGLGLVRSDS
ncbi:MAG: Hsp70 family protein [Pseudohongiellaceae bacterium]